jgi:methylated-DNA-[protein]-cysteine S-methyltransferase
VDIYSLTRNQHAETFIQHQGFRFRIPAVVKTIPKGKVMTYKQVAEKLNSIAYRAVGQVLKNNPDVKNIPCHRVIKSNGDIGGYFGKTSGENIERKIKLLENDGSNLTGIWDKEKEVFITKDKNYGLSISRYSELMNENKIKVINYVSQEK